MADLNQPITIAGGGLAGLSLGCALKARGVDVTIQEAGSYPRHRVCGEFISGVSEETLKTLGIFDLFSDAQALRSLAWHDHGRMIYQDALPQAAYGISRFELDERLRRKFEAMGGNIEMPVRAKPEPREGLVWAAGRKARRGPWLGLKAHVRDLALASDLEMHMGSNGYVGLAKVEDGWINVCGLFRVDRKITARGSELLTHYIAAGGNHELAKKLRDAEWRHRSFSAVAGFSLGRQSQPPGLLCLGDAESMIPPFTGNGMSMAFQAAELALEPLLAWSADRLSWAEATEQITTSLKQKFSRRLAVSQAVHPIILSKIGRHLIRVAARARVLPFHPLLSLIR